MVQSGSAQREPSMEEILASIRRIIEDSDSVRPPEDDIPAVAAGAAVSTQDGEVEAFRAELDAVSEPQPVPSMVEIRETMAEQPAAAQPEPYTQPSAEITPFRSERDAVVTAADPVTDNEPAFEARHLDAVAQAPAFDEPEEADAEGSDIAQPVFMSPSEADAVPEPRSSLLSEQAGRQVAAAFGELSEAFAASRKRSFDEMAEEMLRPMLQDWLDNNLPTLVERLVREEIERVARGGQG